MWCGCDDKCWECTCGCHSKSDPQPRFNYFQTPSESAREIQIHAEMNKRLRETSAPVCSIHKRYQGKRQPRVNCADCWRRYIHLNPR